MLKHNLKTQRRLDARIRDSQRSYDRRTREITHFRNDEEDREIEHFGYLMDHPYAFDPHPFDSYWDWEDQLYDSDYDDDNFDDDDDECGCWYW